MRLTDQQVKNCKGTLAESLGRGLGAIEVKRQSGCVQAYFRYYRDSKPVRIKIGNYGKPAGYSLVEIRTKAGELARLRQEISPTDLKLHLERERSTGGTLGDLLDAYLLDMERRNRIRVDDARMYFKRDVRESNKVLCSTAACEVTPRDIVNLCAKVHNRGGVVSATRLRTYLHAAFQYGLKADYDHTRPLGSAVFGLAANPVSATKANSGASKPGERVLKPAELKALWDGIEQSYAVGFVVAQFIRLCIATAGQRPQQLLRATWDDYDLEKGTVTLIDTKGRNTRKVHVVPLSDRAIEIVKSIPKAHKWPFATWDRSPVNPQSLWQGIMRYLKSHPRAERFAMRDIRRTCKNLLIDAGVDRDSRNLLQSHQLSGIDFKHYDRHDHLPEKRAAMVKYDALLEGILNEQ